MIFSSIGPKLWNNAITLDDLMDEDSTGGGEGVSINDVFYDNQNSPMMTGSPEPAPSSPESCVDIKPVIRPSIIVPVKSKKIFLKIIYISMMFFFFIRREREG